MRSTTGFSSSGEDVLQNLVQVAHGSHVRAEQRSTAGRTGERRSMPTSEPVVAPQVTSVPPFLSDLMLSSQVAAPDVLDDDIDALLDS